MTSAAIKELWSAIIELGCIVGPSTYCSGRLTIHHCGTGGGGRKDDRRVICLCWGHHLGREGIDGGTLSKRQWQAKYGSEISLMVKTQDLLDQLPGRRFLIEVTQRCSKVLRSLTQKGAGACR